MCPPPLEESSVVMHDSPGAVHSRTFVHVCTGRPVHSYDLALRIRGDEDVVPHDDGHSGTGDRKRDFSHRDK